MDWKVKLTSHRDISRSPVTLNDPHNRMDLVHLDPERSGALPNRKGARSFRSGAFLRASSEPTVLPYLDGIRSN